MIDAGFVTNINYVTRTVQATKDLILSIEDDLHDVRTLIRNRVTDQVDRQQLIQLLEQENVELKVSSWIVLLSPWFILGSVST